MWPSDHTPLTRVTLHTLQDALKVVMLNIWANAHFNDHDKVKIVCPHLPYHAYYTLTESTPPLLGTSLSFSYRIQSWFRTSEHVYQSIPDKPRKIISLLEMLKAASGLTRLKFNHWEWKIDWLLILLNIRSQLVQCFNILLVQS